MSKPTKDKVLTVGPGFPGGPTAPEGPGGPLNENQAEVKQVFNTPYITNTPYQKKGRTRLEKRRAIITNSYYSRFQGVSTHSLSRGSTA